MTLMIFQVPVKKTVSYGIDYERLCKAYYSRTLEMSQDFLKLPDSLA